MRSRAFVVPAVLAILVAGLPAISACGTGSSSRSSSTSSGDAAERPAGFDEIEALEVTRADPGHLAAYLEPQIDPVARARAALALARAEHTAALPLLYHAAKDASPKVRANAFFGLGQMDLALEIGREAHDELRRSVETFLTARLGSEQDPQARAAIVRALGRVAVREGLTVLVRVAAATGDERVTALTALGVSGARRQASHSADAALLAAVQGALAADDAATRRAAAYVAFRQKLPLTAAQVAALARDPDVQTRIHAARAVGSRTLDGVAADAFLDDADWRVRVEALRALSAGASRGEPVPVAKIDRALAAATAGVLQGAAPEAHVVAGACDALAVDGTAPAEVAPILAAVVARLAPVAEKFAAARCTCAVAADAVKGRPDTIAGCGPGRVDDPSTGRLAVRVWAKARVSSKERAEHLEAALQDKDRLVRMAAANALAEDGSQAAQEAAARVLATEADPGVAAALLEAVKEQPALLDDVVYTSVVVRFVRSARNLEEAEPLLALAALGRTRTSPDAREAVELLKRHPEPRVREAVTGVPPGERAFGPRARRDPAPAPGELPVGAVLRTDRGDVRIVFEREQAPVAVANFTALGRQGLLRNTRFHRVVPDFVSQGGDPRADGSGGPGWTIPCENSDAPYTRGAVGMALSGKDTGGSQYFLTHSDQPHLDGRYSVFARVVDGLAVMDAIQPDDRLLSVDFLGEVPPL